MTEGPKEPRDRQTWPRDPRHGPDLGLHAVPAAQQRWVRGARGAPAARALGLLGAAGTAEGSAAGRALPEAAKSLGETREVALPQTLCRGEVECVLGSSRFHLKGTGSIFRRRCLAWVFIWVSAEPESGEEGRLRIAVFLKRETQRARQTCQQVFLWVRLASEQTRTDAFKLVNWLMVCFRSRSADCFLWSWQNSEYSETSFKRA